MKKSLGGGRITLVFSSCSAAAHQETTVSVLKKNWTEIGLFFPVEFSQICEFAHGAFTSPKHRTVLYYIILYYMILYILDLIETECEEAPQRNH